MKFSAPVQWLDIRGLRDAYRLLTVFRASNPMMGGIQPENLHWEIAWDEQFVPLDMDDPSDVRADQRLRTVNRVALYCATAPDAVGNTVPVRGGAPSVIRMLLLNHEDDRGLVD
ncbi:MAG: hypothetical protein EBT79_07600 [Actinobacteria bacterium]|nr:hypothetical protein [Actinomycetota bacterium]NBR67124.1 hypothetical protein [Actinomycetota bacterium]